MYLSHTSIFSCDGRIVRYHTNFFLLSVAFCKMGNVRGGLIYRCLQILILQLFFVGRFTSITWIQISTTFTYRTLPYLALRTLRIVTRVRGLYSVPTRIISKRQHLRTSTTITTIQNNSNNEYTKTKWSSYPRTSKSQLRRRKSEMLYVSVSHPIPSHSFIH